MRRARELSNDPLWDGALPTVSPRSLALSLPLTQAPNFHSFFLSCVQEAIYEQHATTTDALENPNSQPAPASESRKFHDAST
jgi:hypothetical protein